MYLCMSRLVPVVYLAAVTLLSYLLLASYYIHAWIDYLSINQLEAEYDFVIVGAGTAGSVVAARLAQNKNHRVLVLEAGGDHSSLFNIPSLGLLFQQSVYDWGYETTPQTHACLGLRNNVSKWPMGRIVGGTSMLNNMVYLKGTPHDYRHWHPFDLGVSQQQDIGWYFNKSTEFLNIRDDPYATRLSDYILEAVRELGFNVFDMNLTTGRRRCAPGCFMKPHVTQHVTTGARDTPANHLRRSLHNNLHLITNAFVTKILFVDGRYEANGVQFEHFNTMYRVRARKEVILCAGVVNSPKLLMLSGIGPRAHLEAVGIPHPWNDLPAVGRNLMDHVTTALDLVHLNTTMFRLSDMLSPFNLIEYWWSGTGPLTTPGCEVVGMVHLNGSDSASPELGIMVMPMGVSIDRGYKLRELVGISDEWWRAHFQPLVDTATITVLPIVLHPHSRGYVELTDADYRSPPIINPQYLTADHDAHVLLEGIKFIKQLVNTKALRGVDARLSTRLAHVQVPACGDQHEDDTDSYWICYIRHMTLSSYHPVGTCSVGADMVVDDKYRVHNTNKLRVVDASVISHTPSANIQSSVIMLAERAVDAILCAQHYTDSRHTCHASDALLYAPRNAVRVCV